MGGIRNVYTSVACNRNTDCADWGQNDLIVFGARNAVCLFDPHYEGNAAKITRTYVQHTKTVTTVKWLRDNCGTERYFLSGADDSLAVLWAYDDSETTKNFLLKGHKSGVNCVAGLERGNSEWLLVTASADSTVRIWSFNETSDLRELQCTQVLELNGGYGFVLGLTKVPLTDRIMLAMSLDDETVTLLTDQAFALEGQGDNETHRQFKRIHTLAGHEDWVRGLDFATEGDDLLLATSAQDCFIRLWRISNRTFEQVDNNTVDILNIMSNPLEEIRVEEKIVQTGKQSWCAITLESVLYGHEGWVYGVHWHKSKETKKLRLLSASIDKSLIIWEPSDDGVWLEKVRVGEVGGNSLGFYGAKFSKDGRSIMGHSYQGGFHIWNQSPKNEAIWTPNVIVGGHFGEVRDLSWEPEGKYLMTVSSDQTTRIHAHWRRDPPDDNDANVTWHEIARPQVHGYDMQALALLSRYKFASGAEEKIVRSFQASGNFIENFRRLTNTENDAEGDILLQTLPKGASVPSLGLSNKAVYNVETPKADERHVKDEYPENYFVPVTLTTPPQEETLMQNTLWPEVQKLYGHGYEIYALAASKDNGRVLASACRATTAEHAHIILWNTATWKQIQKLYSHQLTVTQLSFSPDDRYLLSVSRDRRWSLFERQSSPGEMPPNYTLVTCSSNDKAKAIHTRIIWSCDWSHDGKHFATSSRDGKVVIWSKIHAEGSSSQEWSALEVLEEKNESFTAVAFAKDYLDNEGTYVVAVGSEKGQVRIYQFDGQWKLLLALTNDQAHHLTVKRLAFRPVVRESKLPRTFQLASCGDDHFVRIYELNV